MRNGSTATIPPECVAVVVVTFDSATLLHDLIESLPAGMGEVDWHLVVVDNDSSDDSVAVAKQLRPDATVVRMGRNAGYAAGINLGITAAPEATAVLVLNPDVRLSPGCVPALLSTLRRPGTGIAVPRLVDRAGLRIDSLRREPTVVRALADALLGARRAGKIGRLGEVVTRDEIYRSETVTDWAEGSTLLISADCLDRCGPWDESFFLYSEETEFALRARDHGLLTRYTPRALAQHLEGGSAQSPALWALLVANRVRLHHRRRGPVRGAAFYVVVLLREATRAAMGKTTSRAAVRALLSPPRMRETPGPQTVHHTAVPLREAPVPAQPTQGETA